MGLEFHIILRSVFIHRDNGHLGTAWRRRRLRFKVKGYGISARVPFTKWYNSEATDMKVLYASKQKIL